MRLSVADVFAQLRAEGLASAGADAEVRSALTPELHDELPWHMRLAVGFGAWLATGFLLGSVMAIADLEDDLTRAAVGALLIVGAIWLRRTAKAEFLRQAATAASLAGQGILIFSIGEAYDSRIAGLAGVGLSVLLIWLMPDPVHRFLSTLIAVIAAAAVAVDSDAPVLEVVRLAVVLLVAYVWRIGLRTRGAALAEMLAPVGYALIVGLFGLLLFGVLVTIPDGRMLVGNVHGIVPGRATAVAMVVLLAALVWKIIEELGGQHSSKQSVAALAGVVILGASTLSSPGVMAGVAVLTLAFDRRDRALLGLATLFLLFFGSMYYYSLQLTLLEKSAVLAGSGALLLAIRQRIASGGEEATT